MEKYIMGYKNLSFPEESKFLITGAAGFIGSNLVEALLNMGHKVRGLDNFSTGKKENLKVVMSNPNFELIEGDITNFDVCLNACEDIDFVSHQAAWGSVPRSIEMPQVYEEINVKGTINMLEAARQNNVKRFVYASSSSVYGDHPTLPKQEGIEGKVLSPYALTKKINEEYGRLYFNLYGLETIGLRYFNVFGKRQDPNGYYAAVIPKFVKMLLNNESPIINGDGKQSRDFTYIENVIEANLKSFVCGSKASGMAFNIAFGGQTYLIDLYYKLCGLMDKNITPIYGADRPGDIKHSNADISKAKEFLGYNPQYDFETGLEQAVNWYENNMFEKKND
jgi:UDP-N-acetylglucosamine/UDP-N-acetylgalactosamine 4-epimerase